MSPTFTISRKDEALRLIHSPRQVNQYLDVPKFTLRGVKKAVKVIRKPKVLVSLDLKKGYQRLAISEESRTFLEVIFGGREVASTVLPFGLSSSPYVFTRFTSWLEREIRKRFKLFTAVYIDDFLLGVEDEKTLVRGITGVKEMSTKLGVVISEKTSHTSAPRVEYLEFVWGAGAKKISITDQRHKGKNLPRGGRTGKTWKQVLGKIVFWGGG